MCIRDSFIGVIAVYGPTDLGMLSVVSLPGAAPLHRCTLFPFTAVPVKHAGRGIYHTDRHPGIAGKHNRLGKFNDYFKVVYGSCAFNINLFKIGFTDVYKRQEQPGQGGVHPRNAPRYSGRDLWLHRLSGAGHEMCIRDSPCI